MNKLVAVTIPIYKEEADYIEQICLQQGFKVLGKHPIIFFAPKSLNTSWYEEYCKPWGNFKIERFDDEYFSGIPGYNRLMLSKEFYQRFIDYQYILIYQLDAFIFRDELEYWCNKGYDYIGAPYIFVDLDTYPIKFLSTYRKLLKLLKKVGLGIYSYRHVGNGGFSLRNVNKTLNLLSICNKSAKNWTALMEDNFFTYWGNVLFPFFHLAKEKDAARFAIELDCKKTYEFTDRHVPFGCHAFMRYEPEFWIPLIEKEGYKING